MLTGCCIILMSIAGFIAVSMLPAAVVCPDIQYIHTFVCLSVRQCAALLHTYDKNCKSEKIGLCFRKTPLKPQNKILLSIVFIGRAVLLVMGKLIFICNISEVPI